MKLVRYGLPGSEKPGVVDNCGAVRDLSAHIADLTPAAISPEGLDRLRQIDVESLPKVEGDPKLGPPLAGTPKLICIGLNFSDHAKEAGMAIPSEPIVFMKAISAITGPNGPVVIPKGSRKLDWEVELGVVIGSAAQDVEEDTALDHVAGYCLGNDVSERQWQLERGGQWTKGKSGDTFAPLGPWFVTADEIKDPQALDMWLAVNGERRQSGSTATMIFNVRHLISYLSRHMTLTPGDIILTGTPPGVGSGMKPPVFLKPGDVMTLGIAGLGEQRTLVVSWEDRPKG